MAMREGLEFESTIESDCAPLNGAVQALTRGKVEVHCLRDLTRGGLGTTLIEIAEATGLQITIDESKIPVRDDVAGACEVLGFDPLYLANEGRMIVFVPENEAARALELLRSDPHTAGAVEIGRVTSRARRPGEDEEPHWHHAHYRHAERRTIAANLLSLIEHQF